MLFHHETPTYDFMHTWIKPWVHYIPVKGDLSDLKEKFDWAEANEEKTRKISEAATALARKLGTIEGMDELYHDIFEDPLRRVIDAYQPVTKGASWQDIVKNKKVEQIRYCKWNDKVRCFWSSEQGTKFGDEVCTDDDAERPSYCKRKKKGRFAGHTHW